MTDFKGKTGFITGAGSGIGRCSAHVLARGGANLMIADVDKAGLEETRAGLEKYGVGVATAVCDVSDPAAVNEAVDETVRRFGSLDVAHNNAGILGPVGPMHEYSIATAHKLFNVNVFGVLQCMQAELRHMLKAGRGSIVNTASVSGVHAVPGIGVYTASKHAVIGLTRAAAADYSGLGIRINCVCPGYVNTRMNEGNFTDEMLKVIAAQHPIGRFSEPEEIAEAVGFLLSDRASFSTGSAMFVDGGQTI
jgi:NAD(P)-dependent dehydrogenase (short-subunit alcohol dehydrogenase family)